MVLHSFIIGKASQQVEETFESAKLYSYKIIIAILTLSILLFLAIFMYGMFYFTFVPSPEHEGQIFLEFQPCEETPGNVFCSRRLRAKLKVS